jgi:phenylpropionate dioxygenase-like ring-hydroxylating dioxygenase large terminal subunit
LYKTQSHFFNEWHCIGISNKINFAKPYKANIGDLPLVIWKQPQTGKLVSTINICKHMGSKLDNGAVLDNGCLKCPYHGLEMSENDKFGITSEFQGKIFWSYQPNKKQPEPLPFYNNPNYQKSFLQIDMDCSLPDSAYNTMDMRHPEYVHNKLIGFGNSIPPDNIKYFRYIDKKIGMSFDYSSNKFMKYLNDNVVKTENFHMYSYPSFSWSKVSFNKKNLIIGVHLLPIEKKKTRWYITVCNNYYKTEIQQRFLEYLTQTILDQDFLQMKNQYEDNSLKKEVMFQHTFSNEEPITELKELFENYKYPNIRDVIKMYKESKLNSNIE